MNSTSNEEINKLSEHIIEEKEVLIWQYEDYLESSGVYTIYDRLGRVLYIGKADNIKSRVNDHRLGNDKNTRRLKRFLYRVKMCRIDNPIMRDIYEIYSIDKYDPFLNKEYNYKFRPDIKRYKQEDKVCEYDNWNEFEKFAYLKNISIYNSYLILTWLEKNNKSKDYFRNRAEVKNWIKNIKPIFIKELLEGESCQYDEEYFNSKIITEIRGQAIEELNEDYN